MTTTSVLELDDVIKRHAWSTLRKHSNVVKRWFLEEEDYYCDVDWKFLTLDHNISKFDIRPDNRKFSTDWGTIRTGMKWIPLHACDFENRSETKQTHTFRGSRETTTWIAVELTHAYTISNQVDVDVTFPQQFGHLRAGRDTGFKITKLKGEAFKEILQWEVNSQVEVLPSWKAQAQLLARQESHLIDFEVRTTMSLHKGALPVYFKRRSDKSVAHEVTVDNLEAAFQSEADGGVLREDEQPLVHMLVETTLDQQGNGRSSSKLQLLTRGTCVCVAWSDQKVDIKTEPLTVSNGDDGDVQQSQDGSSYMMQV